MARVGDLRRGDQAGQPGSDDDDVCVHALPLPTGGAPATVRVPQIRTTHDLGETPTRPEPRGARFARTYS